MSVERVAGIDAHAEVVYQYHRMLDQPSAFDEADGVVCCCSCDLRMADHTAELFLTGKGGSYVVFSGGFGTGPHSGANLLGWTAPEAVMFARRAEELGVPPERIIVEPTATNTGENISRTRELLQTLGRPANNIVLVPKPYALRRSYATFRKVWPGVNLRMSSVDLTFKQYCAGAEGVTEDTHTNIMVGDLQRIHLYSQPQYGFQIAQDIPAHVWDSYHALVAAGFVWNLIKETIP